ncbi:MAG: hypothetical protein J0L92_06015 [Deltaproteobacteria bacterium]|nr:hypothetical protein [Deltaproteobacteria bacterium]
MRVEAALSVWLASAGLAGAAHAQDRPPPPIVTDFDGETQADHADLPATRPPQRPLPPIVTEFDAEGDDGAYEPRIDEDEDQSDDVIEEDAAEERRHLQHAMLVERRRQMARSASASSSRARLLASPFANDARTASRTNDTSEPFALERAIDRLELGVSGPNAPVVSTGIFDDGLRNRVGAGLDAFREPRGARIRLEPSVTLSGSLDTPAAFVRAGFTVSGTYRTAVTSSIALFAGGGFEHVSDFSTTGATRMGVVMTNALVARGGLLFDAGVLHGLARTTLGVHLASDTSLLTDDGGMQSAELSVDVVLRSGSPASAMGNVQLCGALHVGYVAPSGARILEEARFGAMLGGCVRDATMGELSLMAEVSVGSLATWMRQRQEEHVGLSLRWSL